jgi:hypothetical protein
MCPLSGPEGVLQNAPGQNDGLSEDEGFSSCKEEDFREANLTTMTEPIQINIEMHELNNEGKNNNQSKASHFNSIVSRRNQQ